MGAICIEYRSAIFPFRLSKNFDECWVIVISGRLLFLFYPKEIGILGFSYARSQWNVEIEYEVPVCLSKKTAQPPKLSNTVSDFGNEKRLCCTIDIQYRISQSVAIDKLVQITVLEVIWGKIIILLDILPVYVVIYFSQCLRCRLFSRGVHRFLWHDCSDRLLLS